MAENPVSQMRAPRKAKGVLQRLLATRQVTADGVRFLEKSLDPFHDTLIEKVALPDGQNTRTLIKELRFQQQLTKPTTHTAGSTFDAHIFFSPLVHYTTSAGPQGLPNGNWTGANAFFAPTGGIGTQLVYCGCTGQTFDTVFNQAFNNSSTDSYNLGLPPENYPKRIVSAGFEVANVTADLYRSGTCTVYRIPTSVERSATQIAATTPFGLTNVIQVATGLPVHYNDIVQDPNTESWEAELGCYVPMTQFSIGDTPMVQPTAKPVAFLQTGQATAPVQGYYGTPNTAAFSSYVSGLQDINFGGAWFTGLNENSTLTVTVKFQVEYLVPIFDPLYPLTNLTPMRDDMALEIYSRALAEIPPGCRLGENPLGEWFNSVMDAIADWAPKIGSAIPGFGPLIGAGIGGVAKVVGDVNRSAQEKEKNAGGVQIPPGSGRGTGRRPPPPIPKKGPKVPPKVPQKK